MYVYYTYIYSIQYTHSLTLHEGHYPSDLLVVWPGTFSTHSADANRRDFVILLSSEDFLIISTM